MFAAIGAFLSEMGAAAAAAAETAGTAIAEGATAVGSKIAEGAELVGEGAKFVGDKAVEFGKDAVEFGKDAVDKVDEFADKTGVKGYVQGFGESFTSNADTIARDANGNIQWGKTLGRAGGKLLQNRSKSIGAIGEITRPALGNSKEGSDIEKKSTVKVDAGKPPAAAEAKAPGNRLAAMALAGGTNALDVMAKRIAGIPSLDISGYKGV